MDRWILSRLSSTLKACESSLENFNFHLATSALKTFFYSNFCDVYLETTKMNTHSSGPAAMSNCRVLAVCLAAGLSRMELFTPFLVNELKKYLPSGNFEINKFSDDVLQLEIEKILEICGSIRQLKNEFNITKKQKPNGENIASRFQFYFNFLLSVHILSKTSDYQEILRKHKDTINCLALCTNVHLVGSAEFEATNFLAKSTAGHLCSFGISSIEDSSNKTKMSNTINEKKLLKLQEDLDKMMKIVENAGYKKSASPKIQQKHLEKV